MGKYVGIFRSENDLQEGLRELLSVRERIKNTHVEGSVMFNPGWHLARDLENLQVCAEATCQSATLRKESRGAHSRTDFPKEDPQLAKVNMCVKKSADGMTVSATPCCRLNVAVTDRAPLIVTVQVVSETPSQPLQPAKTEPWLGVAVRVTVVPPR